MSNLSRLGAGVDYGLQEVERSEDVRCDRLVRTVPGLAHVRLRAEVEHVRAVGCAFLELAHEVVDRRAVGEVSEVHLQAVAQVADVVERAARRRADECMNGGAELHERIREM